MTVSTPGVDNKDMARYRLDMMASLARQMARLSRWLLAQGSDATGLNESRVEAFIVFVRSRGIGSRPCQASRPALVCLVELLRELGVVPAPVVAARSVRNVGVLVLPV